jgi:hypothetical protein
MFEGELGGVLDHFFGGFGTVMDAKYHVGSAGRHRVKPEAFLMRVVGDQALVGKGVLSQDHEVPRVLEIENTAIVFCGSVVFESGQCCARHPSH